MNELEPCPFCGGTKIWIGTIAECEMQDKNHPDYEFNSEHYVAVCDYSEGGGGASTGGSARTVEEAIRAWNRRANNDGPTDSQTLRIAMAEMPLPEMAELLEEG